MVPVSATNPARSRLATVAQRLLMSLFVGGVVLLACAVLLYIQSVEHPWWIIRPRNPVRSTYSVSSSGGAGRFSFAIMEHTSTTKSVNQRFEVGLYNTNVLRFRRTSQPQGSSTFFLCESEVQYAPLGLGLFTIDAALFLLVRHVRRRRARSEPSNRGFDVRPTPGTENGDAARS
jgi:hypothetical protein